MILFILIGIFILMLLLKGLANSGIVGMGGDYFHRAHLRITQLGLRDKAKILYREIEIEALSKDRTGIIGTCLMYGGSINVSKEMVVLAFGKFGIDYERVKPKWYAIDKEQSKLIQALKLLNPKD